MAATPAVKPADEPRPSSPTPPPEEDAPPKRDNAAGDVAKAPVTAEADAPPESKSGAPQLYRWVDKDGKVHFGENPPEEYADTAVKVMDL
jgi:hypothetical protein